MYFTIFTIKIYKIESNNINVETTGGAYAAGTAYPIQLTGPADGVVIKYNTIYSKSNVQTLESIHKTITMQHTLQF